MKEVLDSKSQLGFLLIGILAFLGAIRFFMEYGSIRRWMRQNFQEPDYGWPAYSDFHITLIGAAVSFSVNLVMNKATWGYFYSVCKEKNDEEIRRAKTLKACNSLYKAFYFFFVTVWGYSVLKDSKYLPWTLLGKGNLNLMNENYPVHSWP